MICLTDAGIFQEGTAASPGRLQKMGIQEVILEQDRLKNHSGTRGRPCEDTICHTRGDPGQSFDERQI